MLPFVAQSQVAGSLVEVRLEAACPVDGTSFGEDLGEGFDHQILRLVEVFQIAVEVVHQRVAVTLHQQVGGLLLAVQILPVGHFI